MLQPLLLEEGYHFRRKRKLLAAFWKVVPPSTYKEVWWYYQQWCRRHSTSGTSSTLVILTWTMETWTRKSRFPIDVSWIYLWATAQWEVVEGSETFPRSDRPIPGDVDFTNVFHPKILQGSSYRSPRNAITVRFGCVVLDQQVTAADCHLDVRHGPLTMIGISYKLVRDLDARWRESRVEIHIQVVGVLEGQGGFDFLRGFIELILKAIEILHLRCWRCLLRSGCTGAVLLAERGLCYACYPRSSQLREERNTFSCSVRCLIP
jgi:hypothetical protein